MLWPDQKALQRQTLQKAKPTKAGSDEPAFFFTPARISSTSNSKQSFVQPILCPNKLTEFIDVFIPGGRDDIKSLPVIESAMPSQIGQEIQ